MSQEDLTLFEKDEKPPLADEVRPELFSDFYGQDQLLRLQGLVEKDGFHSVLFWGPPGCGKTTLAFILAKSTGYPLRLMSAVRDGVKEIRAAIEESRLADTCLLFMDEIHRLNKAQQDVLLPALEHGWIKFIGATTENPSFEVNKAILSRVLTFKLEPLNLESLQNILRRAHALAGAQVAIEDSVYEALAMQANGDARRGLNLLEALLALATNKDSIDLADLDALGIDLLRKYDKSGEQHYDTISAMIKSIRGSNPDAAVYYLARMIDSGEDPMFIARRLVIAASEDIGNANPTALLVATNAMQAAHMVGYPEARIILSQAVTYLAASPKSNKAYVAIDKALRDVRTYGDLEIPMNLRNAPTDLMKSSGYGKGYVYAHDDQKGANQMDYLPEILAGKVYYDPSQIGVEAQLKKNLDRLRS